MAYYVNLGYQFPLPESVVPDGSVMLGSAMPMHQLERRQIDERYPHLATRLFDPQLYMAGLDAHQCPGHCAKLASYPWFAVEDIGTYNSDLQRQSEWRKQAESLVAGAWPGAAPTNSDIIKIAVRECLEFQQRLGCAAAIVPSPLSIDPATDYATELIWLDAAIDFASRSNSFNLPLYATLAFNDTCVHYAEPIANSFLEMVTDAISAREVDGVYLVVEQGSEADDTRVCGNTRVLRSILHVVHLLAEEAKLDVAVNFLGAFGLVCTGAGASIWADHWYKSNHRLRLSDKLAAGRAYPTYWSRPALVDINLDGEFDSLVQHGLLPAIEDRTSASSGLLAAVSSGVRASDVPAWEYRQSNVKTAIEHYLLSCAQADGAYAGLRGTALLDAIEQWLTDAVHAASQIDVTLGTSRKTKTSHVVAWKEAFYQYRADHSV